MSGRPYLITQSKGTYGSRQYYNDQRGNKCMGRPAGSPNRPKTQPEVPNGTPPRYCSCNKKINLESAYVKHEYDIYTSRSTYTLLCNECGSTSCSAFKLSILFPGKSVKKSLSALVSYLRKESVSVWTLYDFLLDVADKYHLPPVTFPVRDQKYKNYDAQEKRKAYRTEALSIEVRTQQSKRDFYPDDETDY